MHRFPASEARKQLAGILNRVSVGGERVVLHRHGQDVAAVVPVQDLELLEALEDRLDLETAREALEEPGPRVSLAELKAELGL
jgi:prevent-host-death family protein